MEHVQESQEGRATTNPVAKTQVGGSMIGSVKDLRIPAPKISEGGLSEDD